MEGFPPSLPGSQISGLRPVSFSELEGKDTMTIASKAVLGHVVEGRIETGDLWTTCLFPCEVYPFGFEFAFESLLFKRFEPDDSREAPDRIINPDPDNNYVNVRDVVGIREEVRISFLQCETVLGVSHWKLIDILEHNKLVSLSDAVLTVLNSREYKTTRLWLDEKAVLHSKVVVD